MNPRPQVMVLLVLVPLLAGCLGGQGGPAEGPAGDGRLPTGAPSPAELDARTVDEPPSLFVGQWWQYRFEHERTGISRQVTTVVAGAEGDDLLVGMPVEGFDDAVMVAHLPPAGTVGLGDWSYRVHENVFVPLQFPLEVGRTWRTSWLDSSDVVVATVSEVSGQTASVTFVGPGREMSLLYDARIGAIREFHVPGYGAYEAIDFGFRYNGEIAVPSNQAPILMESRVRGLLDGESNPAAPVATVYVDGPYDHMSLLLMAGPELDRLPGAYRLEAVAPDGTAFVLTSAPPESGQLRWSIVHHDEVVGSWDIAWVVAGHGFGFVEGIGYDARHFLLGDAARPVPLATSPADADV